MFKGAVRAKAFLGLVLTRKEIKCVFWVVLGLYFGKIRKREYDNFGLSGEYALISIYNIEL